MDPRRFGEQPQASQAQPGIERHRGRRQLHIEPDVLLDGSAQDALDDLEATAFERRAGVTGAAARNHVAARVGEECIHHSTHARLERLPERRQRDPCGAERILENGLRSECAVHLRRKHSAGCLVGYRRVVLDQCSSEIVAESHVQVPLAPWVGARRRESRSCGCCHSLSGTLATLKGTPGGEAGGEAGWQSCKPGPLLSPLEPYPRRSLALPRAPPRK